MRMSRRMSRKELEDDHEEEQKDLQENEQEEEQVNEQEAQHEDEQEDGPSSFQASTRQATGAIQLSRKNFFECVVFFFIFFLNLFLLEFVHIKQSAIYEQI